jgi:phytoene desaturase
MALPRPAARAKVIVVGAGLGGLIAAALLAHKGHEVDVFEQQDFAGGKAGSRTIGAYRFDTGPSLLTLPQVFRQVFRESGHTLEDFLELVVLNPLCHYFFPDGTRMHSYSDPVRFAREIAEKTADTAQGFARYRDYGKRIYDAAARLFLWHSLHEPSTYLSRTGLHAVLNFGKIDAFRTLDRAHRAFFGDPRLVQLFDRYATYNGSNPYRLPGTFGIIPYIEYAFGGYAVRGGIHAIPRAFAELAKRNGVKIHLNSVVEEILSRGGSVYGIRVNGAEVKSDVVISNVDVLRTYGALLGDHEAPWARRYRRMEPSSSGLVFYWGMKEAYPELGVHNIFFSSDYRREFDDIFARRVCPADPTVYVNITSKVAPPGSEGSAVPDAPEGRENWFVLLNVPHNSGQDWQREENALRRRAIERMEGQLGKPVAGNIEVEEAMTPADIERATGSTYGSLYGISSNRLLSAFYRHPNRSRRYRGLFFCGGSAHPGGGMPLAVLSGRIAARLVERYAVH